MTDDETLQLVFDAWAASPGLHALEPGATEASIAAAERALGYRLPGALLALYRHTSGGGVLGGNLDLQPVDPGHAGSVVGWTEQLRSWHWPIPAEVLVIGGNGSDEQFGLWRAQDGDPTLVVEIGEGDATLAVIGTSLPRFLRLWTGYYLVLLEAPARAMDILGLPPALRAPSAATTLEPFVAWADPDLPDHDPDPYARPLDSPAVEDVLARARARVAASGTHLSTAQILEHRDADRT